MGLFAAEAAAQNQEPKPEIAAGPFHATKQSLDKYAVPDWFRNAKFGIWAHWGPQSTGEYGDWYARNMYIQGSRRYKYHVASYGHPSRVGFKDVIHSWKTERFDTTSLMKFCRKAGAKYFLPKPERNFSQAFNTAAIAAPPLQACQMANPPVICWGNAPQDVFRSLSLNNWDVSFFKDVLLCRERLKAQFRLEGYNVFNHTQFTGFDTSGVFNSTTDVLTNSALGQYTTAAGPRRAQPALRLTF